MAKSYRQAATAKTVKSRKVLWIVVVAVTAVVTLIVGLAIYFVLNNGAMGEQRKMTSFLEKKYGEKFKVYDVKYINSGFAVKGVWVAEAHPDSNSAVVFEIDKYRDSYEDQYIAALWSQQETKRLQQELKGYSNSSNHKIYAKLVLSGGLLSTATKSSPTFDEAVKYDSKSVYYTLVVDTSIAEDSLVSSDVAVTYSLIEGIRDKRIEKLALDYSIGTISGKKYRCYVAPSLVANFTSPSSLETCLKNKESK